MNVGSLFSGIGGFDLGLERAGGFRTAWFCEQDDFCQHVLAQHWPGVPCYPDITQLRAVDIEPVDVLCGGFPCQDISYAGSGAGLAGARSGLWSEYARLIGELGPRYVVVENVSALLARGLGTVLGDLAALGYDAEWDCIPASAVGAPHRRDRIWLVAYPSDPVRRPIGRSVEGGKGAGEGTTRVRPVRQRHGRPGDDGSATSGADVGDTEGDGRGPRWAGRPAPAGEGQREPVRSLPHPDADGGRLEVGAQLDGEQAQGAPDGHPRRRHADGLRDEVADAGSARLERRRDGRAVADRAGEDHPWAVEPDVGRVAHGVPARVDRLRALGNALVPQIAEWIGARILEHEGRRMTAFAKTQSEDA